MNSFVQVEKTININNIELEKYAVDFVNLNKKNEEVKAWLKVKNTAIEYPIVQAKDNSYYLTHSLDKTYNSAGWIFADYKNKVDGTDKNLVIYGHNRRDGTMFGSLKKILKPDWYNKKENEYIVFETNEGTVIYQVFSVYEIEAEDYYIKTNFKNDNEFEAFINKIKGRSIKDFRK